MIGPLHLSHRSFLGLKKKVPPISSRINPNFKTRTSTCNSAFKYFLILPEITIRVKVLYTYMQTSRKEPEIYSEFSNTVNTHACLCTNLRVNIHSIEVASGRRLYYLFFIACEYSGLKRQRRQRKIVSRAPLDFRKHKIYNSFDLKEKTLYPIQKKTCQLNIRVNYLAHIELVQVFNKKIWVYESPFI